MLVVFELLVSSVMPNHATKMVKLSLESVIILIFIQFGMAKLLETLHTVSNVKVNIFQIKKLKRLFYFKL